MRIGAAEIDITPDFEVELCGFAARVQPSIGVLEPIFARAIYFDDGQEKLLWIAADVIAFTGELVESFRAWAGRTLELSPSQVLLSATHTHSAPATIHLNGAGKLSERYVEFLRGKLEQLARSASMKAEPCTFVTGRAPLDFAIDRRKQPSAHVDPTVWAMAFFTEERCVASVMNYAMHPIALGPGERRISPDWCGAAARFLSAALPGNPVTLVTNGAAGNVNPPVRDIPPERVAQDGELVAKAALAALSGKPVEARLKVRSVTVPLPLEVLTDAEMKAATDAYLARVAPNNPLREFIAGAVEAWRKSMSASSAREVPIELQAVRIGKLTIVAVNGEIFSRFTMMLRERTMRDLFVVGYANAAFGYIPTREAYAEGGYEPDEAHFFYNSFRPKPGGLELLVDRAAELVASL